jgi:predicted transglutaminase-like cysteine proteinase
MPIALRMTRAFQSSRLPVAALLAWLLATHLGCATPGIIVPRYDYFVSPDTNDPWSRKIHRWQERERTDRGVDVLRSPAAVAGSGDGDTGEAARSDALEVKYQAFRAQTRRSVARDIARWIQEQAREHYLPDGPIDRWATFAETMRRNGDDCDGLELLTYNLLRDAGFGADEVYRAIVYRRSDGQHHMVTLWFENREDPWVIDPTGAMTSGMPHMSEVPGWVPLKVFSEGEDFTVERRHFARASR